MPELQTHADLQGVVIMAGATSDIYSPSFHDSVMSRLREGYPETTKGEKVSEPNTGHLVPMERPEAVAREAWKLLRACEPRLAKVARPRL
jgi:pimeloyl-ACP methyl ester carboxylesterase